MTDGRPRRVCVVTGSRAEFGILHWVLRDLEDDPRFELQLVVTGAHLSARHGRTVDEIRASGLPVARVVPLDLERDDSIAVARAMGDALAGCAAAFTDLVPDIVLVLGDRYEILAAAQAAALCRVPLAHVAGGDVTEGALDDAFRDAITALAEVHLATNPRSAARLVSLGADPASIHDVGSPALDHLRRSEPMTRAELEGSLGAPLGERNLVVAFHPVTLGPDQGMAELTELLAALEPRLGTHTLWITGVNADPGSRAVREALGAFVSRARAAGAAAHTFDSLGARRFHALVAAADALVGNSSAGLYEAAALGTWTVDVGDRQRGRLAGPTVLHAPADRAAIAAALDRTGAPFPGAPEHPYGDGRSAGRILEVLARMGPGTASAV